jgi:8-oxo-dGTP pyrophosphatase MutT (NUDIX family)
MATWQTLSSETVYETPWIRVRRDKVLTRTQKELTYSVVELVHPSVYIVATNEKDEILIQRNYKYPIGSYTWSLPAGHSDEGEDSLIAAKRELLEETGLVAGDWVSLGKTHQANGIANLPGEVFLAQRVRAKTNIRDEYKDITEQKFLSLEALEELIRRGVIDEGIVIAALYLTHLYKHKKENT